MSIIRVVPDIRSRDLEKSRAFYVDFLGMDVAMDLGFVVAFASPTNPSAQVIVLRDDGGVTLEPDMSIEVTDVDQVHACAVERGLDIVYPLTNEPWGVRRFFVVDPSGTIVNVLSHLPGAVSGNDAATLPGSVVSS